MEKNESVYRQPSFFKFNLLSKQSEEEIQQLEERDDSSLYAMILVFSGVFIFFILNLIQTIIVQGRINLINEGISNVDTEIANYNDIKALHGEIFKKSNLLIDPLLKDIKISRLLEISSQIVQEEGTILSYNKDAINKFSLRVSVNSFENAINILNNAEKVNEVEVPYIQTLSFGNFSGEGVLMNMSFNILFLEK